MRLSDVSSYIKPPKEKLKRASRKYPCPICNKTGCGVNSQIVLCWRVEAGSKERAINGAYLHFRDNYTTYIPVQMPVEPKASPELIAQVYDSLLDCLVLEDRHISALEARGLSQDTINKNRYRSTPTKIDGQTVCRYLMSLYNLEHVPGFYQDETRTWRLNVQGSGLFIPYRNLNGTMRGMQVRPDRSALKYFWFSSSDLFNGASSGSFIHYARPDLAKNSKEIYITEGGLKADCIAELGNVGVAALAGVNAVSYDTVVSEIQTGLPEVSKIVLAFDIDWKTNVHVKAALTQLYETASKSFAVEIEDWNAKLGKGLDDKLLKEKNAKSNGRP